MQFGLLNVQGSIAERNQFFDTLPKSVVAAATVPKKATATSCIEQDSSGTIVPVCAWNKSDEWSVVRAGLEKDQTIIKRVSKETGIPARMLAATVAPEQLRFFTSERESFKKYFEPLKILGSMSQFSLGVAGIKQATATKIEQYTVDKNSPFYSGDGMAKLIKYPKDVNRSKELFSRLSNSKDHYYSYLYAALYLKEISGQWARSGYGISKRPDILVTLFNIGFDKSHPKSNPMIGGTGITLDKTNYTFGELGTDIYLSDELTAIFPRAE